MSMHIFGGEVEGISVSNMVESYTDSVCRSNFSIDNHYYMIAYLTMEKIEWKKPFLCELDKDAQICRLFEIDNEKYNLEEFWIHEHPTTEFSKLITQVTGKSFERKNDLSVLIKDVEDFLRRDDLIESRVSSWKEELEVCNCNIKKVKGLIAGKKSLNDQIQGAFMRIDVNKSNDIKEFTFTPIDYEEAQKALLSSKEDAMYWKNEGYICFLERGENEEIYYDLHLTTPIGTTIMYGETIEVLEENSDCVNIRVSNSENEYASINKNFFKKNFSPCPVLNHDNTKTTSEPAR